MHFRTLNTFTFLECESITLWEFPVLIIKNNLNQRVQAYCRKTIHRNGSNFITTTIQRKQGTGVIFYLFFVVGVTCKASICCSLHLKYFQSSCIFEVCAPRGDQMSTSGDCTDLKPHSPCHKPLSVDMKETTALNFCCSVPS